MKSTLPLWRTSLHVVCATSVLLALGGCAKEASTPSSVATVGSYVVQANVVTLTTDLPGRTNAWRVSEVRPQVSGVILKRLFTEGSNVVEGQPLYQIDPAPYQATYDHAEAQLMTSQQLAQRDQKLLADNAVSKQQADDAEAAYRQAKADVESARINLEYTKVKSPISGYIGRSSVTEGALVTNGQASSLATVQQLDPIYVDVTQSSNAMLRLRRELESGQLQSSGSDQASVALNMDDGTTYGYRGTLKFSEVTVDETTGSVTLRAIFPNPQHYLLPGMFVHARLDEGTAKGALVVPEQALLRDTTGAPYVWLIGEDSKVHIHRVSVDRTIGNTWLVTSGLKVGDKLVAEGVQNLQDGMSVNASPATTIHIDLGDSAAATDAAAPSSVQGANAKAAGSAVSEHAAHSALASTAAGG